MQKEIKIGEKTFIVRELLAIETDDFDWNNEKEVRKKEVMLSAGLSEEQYNALTLRERTAILKAFYELSGFLETPAKE